MVNIRSILERKKEQFDFLQKDVDLICKGLFIKDKFNLKQVMPVVGAWIDIECGIRLKVEPSDEQSRVLDFVEIIDNFYLYDFEDYIDGGYKECNEINKHTTVIVKGQGSEIIKTIKGMPGNEDFDGKDLNIYSFTKYFLHNDFLKI